MNVPVHFPLGTSPYGERAVYGYGLGRCLCINSWDSPSPSARSSTRSLSTAVLVQTTIHCTTVLAVLHTHALTGTRTTSTAAQSTMRHIEDVYVRGNTYQGYTPCSSRPFEARPLSYWCCCVGARHAADTALYGSDISYMSTCDGRCSCGHMHMSHAAHKSIACCGAESSLCLMLHG